MDTMSIIGPILIAIIPTIATALVVSYLAMRSGFGPLTREVRDERGALVMTLRQRMDILEADNVNLRSENQDLKEQIARLEADKRALTDRVERLEGKLLDLRLDERMAAR